MPFSIGLSGLQSASADLRVTGNNISNSSTAGFKESRAEFVDAYAASALGTSSLAFGTGVRVSDVAQQFTQGTISFTDNNLDLAINGEGFFSLDSGGEYLYSRAGMFSLDREGNMVNQDGAKLRGYMADYSTDPTGEISGAIGTLKIDTANIPPVSTSSITTTLNLDAGAEVPTAVFSSGFTADNPPALNTYNNSSSLTVYDSQGESHVLTMYMVKQPENNQWQVFMGLDGNDITPAPTTSSPNPFTIKFDQNGAMIANDPNSPPTISTASTVTSIGGSLTNVGALGTLNTGDLIINGVTIPASTADAVSTVDSEKSAIAIASAIQSANVPGLTVTVNETNLGLGIYSVPSTPTQAFSAGDFLVNGIDMSTIDGGSGAGVFDSAAVMATGLSSIPGLTASSDGLGNITIVASDGRNIEVQTDGTAPTGATFGNFSLGASANKVQRGSVDIYQTGAESITISGNAPLDAGFLTGTTFATVNYSNSDAITLDSGSINLNTGATLSDMTIDFSNSTQFGSPFAIQSMVQDGSSTGRLASVDVDTTGVVYSRFTNGRSRALGQVLLTNFANVQGLQPQGDSTWSETFDSGVALEGVPMSSNFGAIQAGALEDSNVKLTEELVDLIIAQRNFQANAQTIKTADTTTQTIINMR